jgi:hydrogenase/urease accessory protein HupE
MVRASRSERSWAVLRAALIVVASTSALGHDGRPLYVELTETTPQHYQLQWKVPPSVPALNMPLIVLPKTCAPRSALAEFAGPEGHVRRAIYDCPQGLAGERLTIRYARENPGLSSVMRVMRRTGERHIAVLTPQEMAWTVPQSESFGRVLRQYTSLGVKHIFSGIDHLLFLMCLLWIAGTWRRVLITITGFTLAHSATLMAAALQLARLPVPPVEAGIALSIVFLTAEIAKGPRQSLTWRYPIAVSSSFGLLHGCGFAWALREIGLPQTELVTGLLGFNLGVEIGQVLFAAAVLGAIRALRRIGPEWPFAVRRAAVAYPVGMLASFWLIQRIVAF